MANEDSADFEAAAACIFNARKWIFSMHSSGYSSWTKQTSPEESGIPYGNCPQAEGQRLVAVVIRLPSLTVAGLNK
jgi:hypothetical protein